MPSKPKETNIDPNMAALHAKGGERATAPDEPFPEKWDPAAGPNPITGVFPLIRKPEGASSPLVEMTHIDGTTYCVWLSDSLLKKLLAAGVEEGMPVSIHRSAEKHTFYNAALGRDVQGWQWTVTTFANADQPVRGGGATFRLEDLRAQLGYGEAKGIGQGGELEPDEVLPPPDKSDEEIPF